MCALLLCSGTVGHGKGAVAAALSQGSAGGMELHGELLHDGRLLLPRVIERCSLAEAPRLLKATLKKNFLILRCHDQYRIKFRMVPLRAFTIKSKKLFSLAESIQPFHCDMWLALACTKPSSWENLNLNCWVNYQSLFPM